jgi:dienelactone hydrolase
MGEYISEQEFCCVREGLTIRGKEIRPDNGNLPAIIVSHGFGGNHSQVLNYCRAFAAWGYAAYCYDFCGGCADDEGKSDGKSKDMTIFTECEDLMAVMDYVKSLSYIDKDRITLMGLSQGGFVSALTAAKRKEEIEKLILLYPALCIPDDARKGALAMTSYDVKYVPDVIDCGKMKLGRKFHDTIVDMDPFLEISAYKGPVLILHGTADRVVNYSYAIRAREVYSPAQCQLQLLRGAGHSFTDKQTNSAIASIQQFMLGHKELLTITVIVTGTEVRKEEENSKTVAILFTGYCDNELFRGSIRPGAEDVQQHEQGKPIKLRADYTLEGLDCKGQKCWIHIVNQSVDDQLKPIVQTNSEALAFLNNADLTAVLEGFEHGLTVRIFGDRKTLA